MQASPQGHPFVHVSFLMVQVSEQSIHESPHGHPFVHCGPDRVGPRGAEPEHCLTEIPVIARAIAATTAATVRFCLIERARLISVIGSPQHGSHRRLAAYRR